MSYLNVNKAYAAFDSQLAREEKNDCVVRSLAVVSGSSYEEAHTFCKETFAREDKRGTNEALIALQMLNFTESGLKIGNTSFKVDILGKSRIKNQYKLHGEVIYRQKTLSSFLKDNPKGTYMVLVAGHALSIKDGEVFDWDGMAYKPSRKIKAAYELKADIVNNQLTLF